MVRGEQERLLMPYIIPYITVRSVRGPYQRDGSKFEGGMGC